MSYTNYQSRKLPFPLKYLADLLRYRHLCWNLVASDIRSRFRRTRLGVLWAVIQPLSFALLMAWVWGAVLNVKDYWTFAIYVFSGQLVWEYFSSVFTGSLDSLVSAQGYLKQGRIPFFIFQIRVPLAGLFILLCGTLGLFLMLAALQKFPPVGMHLLLVPVIPVVLFLFMVPIATILSYLGTQFRDLRYIVMIALQTLFFLSPIMMARDFLDSGSLRIIALINPVVAMSDVFREPVLYGRMWTEYQLLVLATWNVGFWLAAILTSLHFGRRIVYAI